MMQVICNYELGGLNGTPEEIEAARINIYEAGGKNPPKFWSVAEALNIAELIKAYAHLQSPKICGKAAHPQSRYCLEHAILLGKIQHSLRVSQEAGQCVDVNGGMFTTTQEHVCVICGHVTPAVTNPVWPMP